MTNRAYRNAAQWQQLIDLWRTSELSITEFCQTHQLSTMSFYKWRQRLAPQSGQAQPMQDTQFIDLSAFAKQGGTHWHIVLSLGNGVELSLSQQ
ncbi:IS66 family insertion sequence element accessory protein TnpB [Rheinheimera baltica]|uniref:IS66 family insertion sequence element accessory protein TnpB n=1 Tax=Rheinheimera baltica TaxID=67576 RepID=A0ABT9I3W8_9GAMM|nr:IS66 family insertion sequence element accessory protein TnpB [Rheinheimera baltica]MDP5138087.1 IS66 family insertion sequence element accessory protein TnpB [Rheinheimera baltica]